MQGGRSLYACPRTLSVSKARCHNTTRHHIQMSLVGQITGEVGNSAASDGSAPFIQLAAVSLPEILAKREVLQHDVRLALLQQTLGQGHVGPEANKCWRTRGGARRQQVLTRLRDVALLKRNLAENKVARKDGVSV